MEPMARIAACGGLMMAMNSSTSYMPRLEMVKVPPWYSSGREPALAGAADEVLRHAGDGAQALLVGVRDERARSGRLRWRPRR